MLNHTVLEAAGNLLGNGVDVHPEYLRAVAEMTTMLTGRNMDDKDETLAEILSAS